jgi:cardiolipin synthase
LVADIHRFTHAALAQGQRYERSRKWWRRRRRLRAHPEGLPAAGSAVATLVVRDNGEHQSDIEREYRVAISAARQRVIIANAYFFPGYRFMKELRDAARRGVDVRLILQGAPDMPIVKTAATMLYHHLLAAGCASTSTRAPPGKVALVDANGPPWPSNLDPCWAEPEAKHIHRAFNETCTSAGSQARRAARDRIDQPPAGWYLCAHPFTT